MKIFLRILSALLIGMSLLLMLAQPVMGAIGVIFGGVIFWYSGKIKTKAQLAAEKEEQERLEKERQELEWQKRKAEEAERRERNRQANQAKWEKLLERAIFIDTETTGLHPETQDEMLSLAIISSSGDVLFDHMLKPERRKKWTAAEEINGITYEMVKNEKPFEDYHLEVQQIFDQATAVIGYNTEFDMSFLREAGITYNGPEIDVMDMYTDYMVKTTGSRERRWKLKNAASHLGYTWPEKAHHAAADATATRYVLLKMLEEDGLYYDK
ncbi:MAG: 3'-5' exonuclease [Solobacterium sp.]|nr:3'-5' exonuclease [Solobacterium sp.]